MEKAKTQEVKGDTEKCPTEYKEKTFNGEDLEKEKAKEMQDGEDWAKEKAEVQGDAKKGGN